MLKQGLFINSESEMFKVFELEIPNFYRMDICLQDAEFHTEPDKVCYSIVKQSKKTFYYGDKRINAEMESHKNKLRFSKLKTENESYWEEGVYYRKQVRGEDDTFFSETIEKAGEIFKETYRDGVVLLQMFVLDEHHSLMLKPFNLHQYECIEIGAGGYVQKSPYVSLSILKTRFNLSHIENKDYKVIDSIEEGRDFLKQVEASNNLVGIDTETDTLEFNLYSVGKLVGVILSPDNGIARYFPFGHTQFENLPIEFLDEIETTCISVANKLNERDTVMEKVGKLLASGAAEGTDGRVRFYGSGAHNKKFERKVFMKIGMDIANQRGYKISRQLSDGTKVYKLPWVNVPIKHDSMECSIVANPVLQKGAHGLKQLTEEATGEKYLEFDDIFLDKDNINFADVDKELTTFYACPDGDNLRTVMHKEWARLPKDSRFIYELECKLADLKAEQEFWGWRIDAKKFIVGYNNTAKTIKNLEHIIHTLARWPDLKITSSDQLSELLYNQLKCNVYVTTNQGKPSTGSKALKRLSADKRDESLNIAKTDICDASGEPIIKANDLNVAKYPIVLVIEKYREYIKLMTAFYNRIEKNAIGYFKKMEDGMLIVDQVNKPCLRYFFWINQNGARTGRQSSPMHQMPKKIKAICLPDSSMHRMCGTDYSQIELRLFFSYAEETEFVKLCENPGNDIHRIIGSIISKREMWEISQAIRSKDKQRNFGVVYLMSGRGLASQKYGAAPSKAQVRECQQSIDDLFHNFKKAHKFIKKNREDVLKYGYMRTMFGRYAYFDKIFDVDLPRDKRESLIRQANNMPVQGTAADIMKIAEVKMREYIIAKGWDELVDTPEGKFPLARVMVSAHDEAVVSYHVSIPEEEILKMKRDCMEMTIEGWAPLFGSCSIIDNWLEGKKDAYGIPIELRNKLIEDYEKTGESCCKTLDRKSEMAAIINKYRDQELVIYMEDLISKYGEDILKVSEYVRHPALTHELVARFEQTEEHKHKHGVLSHNESIVYATERYFEFRKSESFKIPTGEDDNEKLEDDQLRDIMEEMTGLTDRISYLDNDGKIIYLDSDDNSEEEGLMFEDEAQSIEQMTKGEKILVWDMFNIFLVDFEGLTLEECDEGLQLIHSMTKKNGFSAIWIVYNGKSVDTGMRSDKLDIDRITEFIQSKVSIKSFVGQSIETA